MNKHHFKSLDIYGAMNCFKINVDLDLVINGLNNLRNSLLYYTYYTCVYYYIPDPVVI